MFDNLRDSSSNFYEEEQNDIFQQEQQPAAKPAVRTRRKKSSAKFLGMTAQQRFILSVMLMLMVCVMGTLVMFVLGKMSLF